VQAKVHTLAKNEYSTTALEYAEGNDHREVMFLLKQLIIEYARERASAHSFGSREAARMERDEVRQTGREQSARVDSVARANVARRGGSDRSLRAEHRQTIAASMLQPSFSLALTLLPALPRWLGRVHESGMSYSHSVVLSSRSSPFLKSVLKELLLDNHCTCRHLAHLARNFNSHACRRQITHTCSGMPVNSVVSGNRRERS